MKSAAAYTNKRRVMAEAGNTKVEQIGNIATNYGPLQPVLPSQLAVTACGPDFAHHIYFKGCRNLKHHKCTVAAKPPTPVNCDGWYPTYGYVIYETHLEIYPLGPIFFWCDSSGQVETTPVVAINYSSSPSTAVRCGSTYTVLGDLTPY